MEILKDILNENKLDKLPADVRIKEYKNGIAVELLYGHAWLNFHSLLYDFPDTYYFDSQDKAKEICSEIKKLINKKR